MYTITLPSGKRVDISVRLDAQRKNSEIQSPVQANVSYPAEIVSFPWQPFHAMIASDS